MDIKESIRTVPDFPKKGIQFRDITSMLESPEAFNKALIDMTAECMMFEATKIVAIESRGFLFGSPLARDMELPLILARKPGKLPNPTYQRNYTLEYGEATIEVHKDSVGKDEKILIIDDLIATGGTAEAAAKLIEISDGQVAGFIFIINLFDLPGNNLLKKKSYFTRSLIEFPGH